MYSGKAAKVVLAVNGPVIIVREGCVTDGDEVGVMPSADVCSEKDEDVDGKVPISEARSITGGVTRKVGGTVEDDGLADGDGLECAGKFALDLVLGLL